MAMINRKPGAWRPTRERVSPRWWWVWNDSSLLFSGFRSVADLIQPRPVPILVGSKPTVVATQGGGAHRFSGGHYTLTGRSTVVSPVALSAVVQLDSGHGNSHGIIGTSNTSSNGATLEVTQTTAVLRFRLPGFNSKDSTNSITFGVPWFISASHPIKVSGFDSVLFYARNLVTGEEWNESVTLGDSGSAGDGTYVLATERGFTTSRMLGELGMAVIALEKWDVTKQRRLGRNPWGPFQKLRRIPLILPADLLSLDQLHFRWRLDDGSESAATWLQPEDVQITRAKNLNTRLRVLVDAAGDPISEDYQLEFREKDSGDPWTKVQVI